VSARWYALLLALVLLTSAGTLAMVAAALAGVGAQ